VGERILGHVAKLVREGPGYMIARARARRARLEKERDWQNQPPSDNFEIRNEIVERASYRAFARYTVRPYDGDVLLLKSIIKLGPSDGIGTRSDPLNGWGPHLTGRLYVETVNFEHLDILTPGAAAETASIIRDGLNRADASDSAEERPMKKTLAGSAVE
jgi:thioesterase domain-containing protein